MPSIDHDWVWRGAFLAAGIVALVTVATIVIALRRRSRTHPQLFWPIEVVHRESGHDADEQLGAVLVARLIESKWIHRRVESVRFLGAMRVRRHVSIDTEVPRAHRQAHRDKEFDRAWTIVPLALVAKRLYVDDQEVLRDFDTRDESDAAIPVLGSYDVALATWSLLVAAANRALTVGGSSPLEQYEKEALWIVAASPKGSALDYALTLVRFCRHPQGASGFPRLAIALDNAVFVYLVGLLANNFLLLANLDGAEQSRRRILKFRYDVQMPYRFPWPWRREFWERLGWVSATISFSPSVPLPCDSLHFELQTPDHVEATEAWTYRWTLVGTERQFEKLYYDNRLGAHPSLPHMALPDIRIGAQVGVEVSMRARREAAAWLAFGMSLLLAIGLWLGAAWPHRVTTGADSVQAVVLLLPGLLAGAVLIRQEHQFVSWLMLGTRLLVCGLLVLCAVAAISVSVWHAAPAATPAGVEEARIRDLWHVLRWVGAAVAILLAPPLFSKTVSG